MESIFQTCEISTKYNTLVSIGCDGNWCRETFLWSSVGLKLTGGGGGGSASRLRTFQFIFVPEQIKT